MSYGQKNRECLEADIEAAQQNIHAFNTHLLNHKHLLNAFAVVIMGLIFLGMLVASIAVYLWALCGTLIIALIVIMWRRGKLAKQLDLEMEAAQKAFKEYERSRRKKK